MTNLQQVDILAQEMDKKAEKSTWHVFWIYISERKVRKPQRERTERYEMLNH